MGQPRKKHATYADVEALPANLVGQIVDGDLFALPRPTFQHGVVSSNAGGDINARFGRNGPPGGWWIVDEPELHFLGGDILVLDLGGWRRERLPARPHAPFQTIAPDWVLEVLSPSTASFDRIKKARIYAREGVRWMWLIDPEARTIEANRLHEGAWLRIGAWNAGENVRAEPFEAVEFETSDWFLPEAPELSP